MAFKTRLPPTPTPNISLSSKTREFDGPQCFHGISVVIPSKKTVELKENTGGNDKMEERRVHD
jgi:hypothetical protein